MAKSQSGRRRANVDINVLDQIELRSRRSIRDAERAKKSRKQLKLEKKQAKLDVREFASVNQEDTPTLRRSVLAKQNVKVKFSKRKSVRRAVTMFTASGIFVTVGLPAYAFSPQEAAMAGFATINASELAEAFGSQELTVAGALATNFDRINAKSTSASSVQRQTYLDRYRSYQGPSAEDYVKNPPYSKLDGATVLKVAAKYVGTPYVFGGETPNGFDCSGYVKYVFAQFGIDLPHYVPGQAAAGIIIPKSKARPGDLVIINDYGHNGIYAGAGMMYHAPRTGDYVKLAPIFTESYFIVRLKTR